VDCSKDIIRVLSAKFDPIVLSEFEELKRAFTSQLLAKIPVDRMISTDSALTMTSVFEKSDDGREAVGLITKFQSFEDGVLLFPYDGTEECVLAYITCITGKLWLYMSNEMDVASFSRVLSFNYNAKDSSGVTEGSARPDETIYLGDFLAVKGEHKRYPHWLDEAISDLTSKHVDFNHANYGPHIIYMPVYVAAGKLVEFGVLDVRSGNYIAVVRYDVSAVARRSDCFITCINYFRLLHTMNSFVPSQATPFYKEMKGVTIYPKYVVKNIPRNCTCPKSLYNFLESGSVPYSVKVEHFTLNRSVRLKITPVGLRTATNGEGLTLKEVRIAVKCVLKCLDFIHSKGFVHRDIRWANVIREFEYFPDMTVKSCKFLLIDYEFAAEIDSNMNIHDYIFKAMVPFGQPYRVHHDLELVGNLFRGWRRPHGEIVPAGELATIENFLKEGLKSTASTALLHAWLIHET
jgi:serine/threonine protein kinase